MADTFMSSFNQGLNLAHTIENDKRVQQAQMMQQRMQMMQLQQMAQQMAAQEEARKAYDDVETPAKFAPAKIDDPNKLTSGDVQQLTPASRGSSPAMQSALSMLPPGLHAAAKVSLQRTGELPKWFPKLDSASNEFTLGEGQKRYRMVGNEAQLIAEGAPKTDKDPSEIRTFREVMAMDPDEKRNYFSYLKQKREASPYPDIARMQNDLQRQMKGGELRKEFGQRPETKYYKEINPRFATLEKALEASKTSNNKVAVDQAIINMYNKMMDPDSVVRESEYARTTEDLSMWNRLKGKVEKWKAGGPGLTQDDREAMYRMAKEFNAVAEQKYQDTHSEYTGYVKNIGLDPNIYMEPMKGKKKEKNAPNSNYPPMNNTLPKGAKTGKYNGEPAYTTDGKTFYHALTNKRLN